MIQRQPRAMQAEVLGCLLLPQSSFLSNDTGNRQSVAFTALPHCFVNLACTHCSHSRSWEILRRMGKKLGRRRTCFVPGMVLGSSTHRDRRKEGSKQKESSTGSQIVLCSLQQRPRGPLIKCRCLGPSHIKQQRWDEVPNYTHTHAHMYAHDKRHLAIKARGGMGRGFCKPQPCQGKESSAVFCSRTEQHCVQQSFPTAHTYSVHRSPPVPRCPEEAHWVGKQTQITWSAKATPEEIRSQADDNGAIHQPGKILHM